MGMNEGQAPRSRRLRGQVSLLLVVLATLSALAGGLCLYVREEVVDSSAFADRAVSALRQPAVGSDGAREMAVQGIGPSVPDLVAAGPVIESAVEARVSSSAFRPVT